MKLTNVVLSLTALLTSSLTLSSVNQTAAETEEESKALVSVGELAPDFTATTTDNSQFSLSASKGKIVLLDFFATWCPPCKAELPHLEKEVWRRFKKKGLLVVLVGREHDLQELTEFKKKQKLSMTVAADPKRQVFEKYAKDIIPRTFVVGKDGKVIWESEGFDKAEFKKMTKAIEAAL